MKDKLIYSKPTCCLFMQAQDVIVTSTAMDEKDVTKDANDFFGVEMLK